MSNIQEEILRDQLGKTAKFWLYGRETRTPMNFVLDEVERQIGSCFSVYWVDDGPPEVFTLPGLSPSPIVFSPRYLSLCVFIRQLFVEDRMTDILDEVAEQTTLKLMAEMALRYGDPDYAVLAFVKSVTEKGIWISDSDEDQLMALEHEPKNESYMSTWFYGLVHELGHLQPNQIERFSGGHPFSDDGILNAIKVVLDNAAHIPDSFKQEAIERALQPKSESVLAIDHLRSEGTADIFAVSVLFQTTYDIMREINQEKFVSVKFMQEMIIFMNIIALIDRCRRVALIASATTANREAVFESLLHPFSIMVRVLMQRHYLESAVTRYSFGTDEPTREQFQQVEHMIDQINKQYLPTIDLVEKGVARAIEFSLFHERRENDWVLLEAFRKDLPTSALSVLESRRFCDLADSLKKDSKLLRALKSIVEDPSKPIHPDPIGDLVYSVPWVEGPNGFNRPFGLDTKYGHVVFVFVTQDDLYDTFFKASDELQPGFTLKNAAVCVPRKERLGPELAANMPGGQSFQMIVQETEEFAQYMKELADGTIWED